MADNLIDITTVDALAPAYTAPVALIYKHSPYCPVSTWAFDEVLAFARDHPTARVFMVDVVRRRALSRRIAGDTGVLHESPQVLLMRAGRCVWTASHSAVTAGALVRQYEAVGADPDGASPNAAERALDHTDPSQHDTDSHRRSP